MYSLFQNGGILENKTEKVMEKIKKVHSSIDEIAQFNQLKVLRAFQNNQVGDHHFHPSTGYGYNDSGRDTLEKVYADVFGAESALVRPQIISGTHAIALSLFGVLRPGDELLYITGKPYDTLEEIVGIRGTGEGSLKEYNITYQHVDLTEQGTINYDAVQSALSEKTKMIGIQRSKGYADRPSFTVNEIKEMIEFVKGINKELIVFVDNCYGEFVEQSEPIEAGADIIAGSLIKNPGGGLAKTGGYIAGKETLINRISYRLTSPGIGREAGASLYSLQEMYQGFFLAPHVTAQALKGAVFTAAFLEELGMQTRPAWNAKRTDLIQSVIFDDRDRMIKFCQAIQKASPVNSYALPYPDYMPGYEDDVIMAAGTFIQGASIELTADGPIRPPYIAFVQGGLTFEHVKIAVLSAVDELLTQGLVTV
ncbi:aminotransferase class I/II-fold pyridoxal phosphate-dependent enzyme [Fictibacillus barbaricus]|uniref:Cystathionine beta-lyase family protein involved in aluminum resistance n=1 Tax=Fictibacillus barbaricus TaxID=182136 RepID=A0ABU1TYD5_9BACL|nr:methionine gamma-lyase family protein [Fictibacillus barbaricus]MDR7072235.1 cystathionine beta-lyase family protein involved in aluminum resistance [Fictibacillus barbaricus]